MSRKVVARSRCVQPSRLRRSRAAPTSWPAPNSTMRQPPGASLAPAVSQSARSTASPSSSANSAVPGSKRDDFRLQERRVASARHRADSRRSDRPDRRPDRADCRAPAEPDRRHAVPRDVPRRDRERRLRSNRWRRLRADGSSWPSATARQPLPVPTSTIRWLRSRRRARARASSTMSSVSGRGMSTSGVTSNSRPQNSR